MSYPYTYGGVIGVTLSIIGFCMSLLALWMMGASGRLNPFKWTRTITNLEGEPVMFIKTLWKGFGRYIDLHKFVKADKPGCFHTHPAFAYRFCLWGGYREEMRDSLGSAVHYTQLILPGHFSLVAPDYCHRIDALVNRESSWSLWFRGPVIAKIKLVGEGWPPDVRGLLRTSGDHELGKDLT